MTALLLVLLGFLFQQTGGSVEGVVVRADTREPITDARILLVRTDGRFTESVVGATNESGRFAIVDVPPGEYRVFAEHEDYVRTELSAPLAVAAGQRRQDISFTLSRLGVVIGRVLTELGEPAPKVFVRAWLGPRLTAETRTNDLGEYRLFGLVPGAYVISAERYTGPSIEQPTTGPMSGRGLSYVIPGPPSPDSPGEGRSMQVLSSLLSAGGFVDPRALTGQTYPMIFYPGMTDRTEAKTLDLHAGEQLSGIDMQLAVRERVAVR